MHCVLGFLLQFINRKNDVDIDYVIEMAFNFPKLSSYMLAYGWRNFQVTSGEINVIDINVILSVDKLKQKAEATVHLSGKTLFAETDDSNLYVSIDNLVDALDRQILKHKDKNSARRHDDTADQAAAE